MCVGEGGEAAVVTKLCVCVRVCPLLPPCSDLTNNSFTAVPAVALGSMYEVDHM